MVAFIDAPGVAYVLLIVRRLVPMALVLALGVACATEPRPRFATPTSTTHETPDEAPSGSEEPEVRESARAFLIRFNEVGDEVQNTGDATVYRAMTRECESCDAYADNMEQIYRAGGFIEFGGSEILSIERSRVTHGGWPTFDVETRSAPTRHRTSATAPEETFPGGDSTFRTSIEQDGTSWVVRRVSVLVS